MKFAAAVLGAVFMSANAAEEWVVSAPMQGADKAPTFIVTGSDPGSWPLDYPLAKVGMPCGAEAVPAHPEWRLVLGRKGVAVRCEVKK
jgi:hypothetical protein